MAQELLLLKIEVDDIPPRLLHGTHITGCSVCNTYAFVSIGAFMRTAKSVNRALAALSSSNALRHVGASSALGAFTTAAIDCQTAEGKDAFIRQ